MKGSDQKLSPAHHLASAAEAGALVRIQPDNLKTAIFVSLES